MPRKQGNIGSLLQGVSQQNFKNRLQGMHEEQVNFIPHETAGIIKRSPTKLISKLTSSLDNNAKMHYVKASDGIEYIIVITNGDVKVFNTLGVEQTLNLNNATYLDSININTDISLVTVGDYTIINNKTVTPEMEAVGVCTTSQEGSHIIIQQGEFNTRYEINLTITALNLNVASSAGFVIGNIITGSTSSATGKIIDIIGNTIVVANYGLLTVSGTFIDTETVTEGVNSTTLTSQSEGTSVLNFGTNTPDGSTASDGEDIKVDKIAETLASTVVSGGGSLGLSAVSKGNTIFMDISTSLDNIGMKIEVSDDSSERLMSVVSSTEYELDALEDLPRNYTHNRTIKISSNSKILEDDFFMKFIGEDATSTDLQRGEWKETVQECITTEIDPLLAPHALVKLADDTFYFGSLDGTVVGGTTIETWSPRAVGSDITNPLPAWIGRPIEHLNIFQQRLIVLSDEFISTSKTSEFFNFFRTTATEILDSDAIEVSPTGEGINLLKKSIQQNKDLLIFSDTSQYLIKGDIALTPSTIAISEVSSYSSNQIGELVSTGDTVLFTSASGVVFSEVHELFIADRNNSRAANNLTKLIPTYITNNIKKARVDTNLGLVAFSAGNANKMYFYKYINNNKERVQSAWYTFESNTFAIADYIFYPHGMYLLTRDPSGMYLESMSFDLSSLASGVNYDIYLDRRQEFSAVNTSVTTDFDITSDTIVVQGNGCPNAGYTVPYTAVGNVITLEEDMLGGVVYVGNTYDSTFTVTAPRMFTQDGRPSSRGRLVVNQMIIDFEDTVRFNTTSVSKGITYNKEYEGVIAGESLIGNPDISSGTFKVAVKEKNSDMGFSITSDTHFPVRITNIDYEGQYSPNARR